MNTQTQKHTAGPWEVMTKEKYGITGYCIAQKNGRYIAETKTYGTPTNKENWDEANARLIAAAPELLEACNTAIAMTLDNVVGQAIREGTLLEEEMHAGLCLLGYIRRKALKTYEQALAKAEGKL